jgi:integral membrane sensor domain MASE1
MKLLGFRNRLAARPVSDVAPAPGRLDPATVASATPQRHELRLTPWAALAAVLAAITVALCEPSGLAGWLKALAAGCIVPGGAFAIVKTATGQWRAE